MFNNKNALSKRSLDQTVIAVVTINERNDIVYVNEAAEKLWGYPESEIMGKNIRILVPKVH